MQKMRRSPCLKAVGILANRSPPFWEGRLPTFCSKKRFQQKKSGT